MQHSAQRARGGEAVPLLYSIKVYTSALKGGMLLVLHVVMGATLLASAECLAHSSLKIADSAAHKPACGHVFHGQMCALSDGS